MDFKSETGLSTREIVDELYYDYGYIIYPRQLNAILRGNVKPDFELKGYLANIHEKSRRTRNRRTQNSITNFD